MPPAPFQIVRGHTVPPRDPKGRREGFTTGSAAAAAAKAACLVLLENGPPETVTLQLPISRLLEIPINTLEWDGETASAGVVKDAGDDPDVTHGAEIFASVRRVAEPGIHLRGGVGVGTVTQRGLELPVGSPAINPVPQRMIRQAVAEVLGNERPEPGVEVVISVPRGEELARRTFNARIGIVGGISILGTTGIVRALSTAAWRASVVQAIDVAAANSVRHIVLTTGGRSETFARHLYPELPEMAFVQMGIFTGDSLKRAAQRGVPRVSLCAMIGKLSKTAAGKMQTHVAGNQVDCAFLGQVAREIGAPAELVARITQANTARHVQELIEEAGFRRFYLRLCELAAERCAAVVPGKLAIEVVLFDFEGAVLGRAAWERSST
ncbi:MAG: cobalt-precorrin-5B (C(1))-methyltransferase [Planctomycetes bacterium]|nr:cobalt-precorrin-5B (C(1))-methyltransferase [Planctomycetota bacterium]